MKYHVSVTDDGRGVDASLNPPTKYVCIRGTRYQYTRVWLSVNIEYNPIGCIVILVRGRHVKSCTCKPERSPKGTDLHIYYTQQNKIYSYLHMRLSMIFSPAGYQLPRRTSCRRLRNSSDAWQERVSEAPPNQNKARHL